MAPQIAFVGIGPMGEGMSENLVAKGKLENPLILWNRTKERATEQSEKIGHSSVVDTLQEVVSKGDIIWTCLQDEVAVGETMNELLDNDVKGKLFVDSSTISPTFTSEISKRLEEAGAEFVAVPVFGDSSMAKAGVLTLIPAGNPDSVKTILPYLNGVVGRAVVDLSGEEPAQASLLKFIGNVMIMTTMETAAEMCVFAEKTHLGPHNILKLFEALMPTAPHVPYTRQMINGEYHKAAGVSISQALALSSKVLGVAKGSGVALKSYEVAVKHLEHAQASTGGSGGILGIYGAVREESGLPYEN